MIVKNRSGKIKKFTKKKSKLPITVKILAEKK